MSVVPVWLHMLSIAALAVAVASALIIAIDEAMHPQHMWIPVVLVGSVVLGTWVVDFAIAFIFGIAFQYFTIKPMKQLSPRDGLVAALKADSLSLTAWQVGMYGWMAIALFLLFSPGALPKNEATFWFMMQIAMFAGWLTRYPVNWWLLRAGIKETM